MKPLYWMELLIDSKLMTEKRLQPLMEEANELISIIISSIKTARKKGNASKGNG